MHVPVALLIFNRPETTERVFSEIARARPATLLVVADGPRPNRAGEAERCAQTRAIIDRVDWPCEVLTNYADANLGCKLRVSSGIDWVFQTVEEAIILEDDCVPHPTFFRFCAELLERHRDDDRIAQISGINFAIDKSKFPFSYDFTHNPYVWGWASWRRAWKYYDVDMALWPLVRDQGRLPDVFGDQATAKQVRNVYNNLFEGITADTWDWQWRFACHTQNMLTIVPSVNLVSNIGFGVDAAHTVIKSRAADVPTQAMTFPLTHPPYVLSYAQFEASTNQVSSPSLIMRFAARVLPRTVKAALLRRYQAYAAWRARSPQSGRSRFAPARKG